MGVVQTPLPVKLFVGVLASGEEIFGEAEQRLSAAFGPVDIRSAVFPFDSTHYYDDEMGARISRAFYGLERLISAEELAEIKLLTNRIEAEIAARHTAVPRPANLDPGYLELSKIVLASTKNFYHRILLKQGIYAEVTLHYQSGAWHPFPWTFPDFRTPRYHDFFTELRSEYRRQLRAGSQPAA
jgi:hypothetical protein